MSEPTLFDTLTRPYLAARTTDPDTSVEAAQQITAALDLEVLAYLRATGRALTDDELVAGLPHLYGPTVRSARSRLTKAGVVQRVGEGVSARGNRAGKYQAT